VIKKADIRVPAFSEVYVRLFLDRVRDLFACDSFILKPSISKGPASLELDRRRKEFGTGLRQFPRLLDHILFLLRHRPILRHSV
jgi:hypothetical protein